MQSTEHALAPEEAVKTAMAVGVIFRATEDSFPFRVYFLLPVSLCHPREIHTYLIRHIRNIARSRKIMDFLGPLLETLGLIGRQETGNNQVSLLLEGLKLLGAQRIVGILHDEIGNCVWLNGSLAAWWDSWLICHVVLAKRGGTRVVGRGHVGYGWRARSLCISLSTTAYPNVSRRHVLAV